MGVICVPVQVSSSHTMQKLSQSAYDSIRQEVPLSVCNVTRSMQLQSQHLQQAEATDQCCHEVFMYKIAKLHRYPYTTSEFTQQSTASQVDFTPSSAAYYQYY